MFPKHNMNICISHLLFSQNVILDYNIFIMYIHEILFISIFIRTFTLSSYLSLPIVERTEFTFGDKRTK